MLNIDPAKETHKITSFINSVLKKQRFEKVVIGLSGGIDSATSFYLLKEVIAPENIFAAHLYYQNSLLNELAPILKDAKIPKSNIYEISIDDIVESFQKALKLIPNPPMSFPPPIMSFPRKRESRSPIKSGMTNEDGDINDKVRLGNIMARIRMIILYDLAKKHNALVCGTENKSEFLLGYFTRFGDEASDFEPIQHLYKTQIFQLANFLNIPKSIIDKTPTADLWPGQTDELEYGFTYKEADQVLFYYYDKKVKIEDIKGMGFENTEKIVNFSLKNFYKHRAPYTLSTTNTNPNTKNH